MTATVGRLVTRCAHAGGWTQEGDAARCDHCGTRRFTGYAALLLPELPQWEGCLPLSVSTSMVL
ncbi:DUF6255 family natural product biosynthesis protein [Streptomyces abikoensis]